MVRGCYICKKLYVLEEIVGSKGTSFHRFPKREEQRKLWISLLGIECDKLPSENAVICSDHLDPSDFQIGRDGRKKLKPGSLPIIHHAVFESESLKKDTTTSGSAPLNKVKLETELGSEDRFPELLTKSSELKSGSTTYDCPPTNKVKTELGTEETFPELLSKREESCLNKQIKMEVEDNSFPTNIVLSSMAEQPVIVKVEVEDNYFSTNSVVSSIAGPPTLVKVADNHFPPNTVLPSIVGPPQDNHFPRNTVLSSIVGSPLPKSPMSRDVNSIKPEVMSSSPRSSSTDSDVEILEEQTKRKRKRITYVGDLESIDFSTPEKRERNLDLLKTKMKIQQKKIKVLQTSVRRLKRKVETLKELLQCANNNNRERAIKRVTSTFGPSKNKKLGGKEK